LAAEGVERKHAAIRLKLDCCPNKRKRPASDRALEAERLKR
jgi:hypothetical protein